MLFYIKNHKKIKIEFFSLNCPLNIGEESTLLNKAYLSDYASVELLTNYVRDFFPNPLKKKENMQRKKSIFVIILITLIGGHFQLSSSLCQQV